jgi:iron complex transport system substrate-binding protein
MNRLLYAFILLLFLTACHNNTTENKQDTQSDTLRNSFVSGNQDAVDVQLKYAQGFQVVHGEDYIRVIVPNPWDRRRNLGVYVLVDKGRAESVELQEGETLIELPLERVAIMSSSNVGYFSLLNQLDLIKAVADGDRLYNKKLRQGIDLGSVRVLGNSASVNTEQLLVCDCDIFVQTAFQSVKSTDRALKDAGIAVLYNTDWMEKTPLGRAEWIKFFGLLTGKNEQADSIFRVIEQNYIALKQLADTLDYKPDVLVGALYKDVWYMPGGASYKAHLLADAGTAYHWANDSTEGSLALSFETVVANQLNAPVWIDVPFRTKKELLASDERYAAFDAFKIGTMYHNLNRANESGGNDYWETGLCRPDEVLADLVRIFHFEELPDGELKYYGRVQ